MLLSPNDLSNSDYTFGLNTSSCRVVAKAADRGGGKVGGVGWWYIFAQTHRILPNESVHCSKPPQFTDWARQIYRRTTSCLPNDSVSLPHLEGGPGWPLPPQIATSLHVGYFQYARTVFDSTMPEWRLHFSTSASRLDDIALRYIPLWLNLIGKEQKVNSA